MTLYSINKTVAKKHLFHKTAFQCIFHSVISEAEYISATQRKCFQHNGDLLADVIVVMVIVLSTLLYKCTCVFLVEMDAKWT